MNKITPLLLTALRLAPSSGIPTASVKPNKAFGG